MLESGALSDFTVICGNQEWKVHRFVLSRCPYFKPMVSKVSPFKVRRPIEWKLPRKALVNVKLECLGESRVSRYNHGVRDV